MTDSTDRVLNGRYRIISLIGRGGMADVYSAQDLSLHRTVAVKMLRPDLARDPMFQTRFRREAQSSASLNHPNIVGVYDTGQAEIPENGHEVRTPFIVMEHVDGVTLRHILHGTPSAEPTGENPPAPEGQDADGATVPINRDQTAGTRSITGSDVLGVTEDDAPEAPHISAPLREKIDHALGRPLTEQEAAGYMSGILSALSYSHAKGIVHRDIKPSNVMVSNTGDVKVMDFGIARAVADSAQTMTQTSAVVGTAQYLSPEQARGEVVDHRSDLYSAGCVLFELLTNRPPFTGESPVSVAYQHVREEPPMVSDFNNRVAPAMESVVAKALIKDPALRFQSAEEFNQALQNALYGIPVDDAPTAAMPAVGARSSFDDLVTPAAAGPQLSARTPEDPDIDDYYDDYRQPRRRRRGGLVFFWIILGVLLLAAGAWGLSRMLDGSATVEIPDIEGMTRSEAVAELTDMNLRPEIELQAHAEIAAEHAIGTDPEAGSDVEPQSTVILYISSGQENVRVPDGLQGETEESVRATLEDIGLEIGEISEEDHDSLPEGTLISTTPEAGTEVEPGSTVDLLLSTGMRQLPTGLVGAWRSDVETILNEEGINYQLEWEELSDPEGYFAGEVFELTVDGQEIQDGESIPNDATLIIHAVSQESFPDEDEEEDEEDEDPDATEEPTDEPTSDEEEESNGNGGGNGNGNGNGGGGNGGGGNGNGGGNGGNGNRGNGNGNGNNQDEG
ncbi:protein kinase domain-containing protein [Nesterenkonia rhizosphaerae]|uniref:non-specific serine/threonine protein kinase n=1 Tax=Nesterenkonia rhizosphaerae TaxID=1348272 RepID=A0ABP9G0K0_9MICC